MVRRLLWLVLLWLSLAACARVTGPTPSPSAPVAASLRVENGGAVPIERLVVIFPDERHEFNDIAPGAASDWVVFEQGVYAYAAFEGQLAGQTFMQPVVDWVGETPLEGQAFTYVVSADPQGGPQNQWITTLQVRSE